MRKIKFRGKVIHSRSHQKSTWIYGMPTIFRDGSAAIRWQCSDKSKNPSAWETQSVIPGTVGQFTGLLDKNISLEEPAGTITCVDHHALVSAQFLASYDGNGGCHDIDSPAPTIPTKDKFALINPQFLDMQYGQGPSPYLVCTEEGNIAIEIYETDSPMTVKIKEFMALYNIFDIKMRMLKVVELKRIQGFPDDYVLFGNQSDQKKFIGNAVHTSIPKAWCPALCQAIQKLKSEFVAV